LRRIQRHCSCNIDRNGEGRVPSEKITLVKGNLNFKNISAIFLAVTVILSAFEVENNAKDLDLPILYYALSFKNFVTYN
jgi:hypothetical protein